MGDPARLTQRPQCVTLTFLLVVTASVTVVSADEVDLSWLQRQRSHSMVRLEDYDILREVALLGDTLDPEWEMFTSLLDPMLRPRYVTTAAHESVRQHLVNTMSSLGWHVDGNNTFDMLTPRGSLPFTNVIATHDLHAPRRLVLACHYDSIYGRDSFVAATDSAVPCAMMLYLATLITKRYLDPVKGRAELTLQLMFFDGEEAIERWTNDDSIYGARHMAEHLHTNAYVKRGRVNGQRRAAITQLQRIDMLVLLDLLGAAKPQISNYVSDSNPQFKHLSRVENRLRKEGVLSPGVDKIFNFRKSWGLFGPPGIADDHLPFMSRGVKILHLISYPFPEVWHKDSDNGRIIHYPTVANLNRILRVFVLEYLGTPAYK